MTTVWSKIRTRAGVTVVAGVLGVAGMGTAAAAIVVNQGAVEETAPVITPTTSAPTVAEQTSAEQTSAEATPVVETPVVESPAATVETVTPTRSGPSLPPGHRLPDLAPGQDPEGAGSIGPDGNYTPAPPIQYAGDAPLGPDANAKPPAAEPLPGEPNYVPPGG